MRADRVIAIQEVERDFFDRLLGGARPVKTVGHFPLVSALPHAGDGRRVMFLGANATLNVQSITIFLDEVWPLLHEASPRLELHIYGGVIEAVTRLAPNVFLHKETQDLSQAYATADIVINPMAAGTGLKIKTIEALACGRALVASPVAVEGLPVVENEAGVPWLVAENPQEWVAHLLKLSADAKARQELSRRALEYASAYVQAQRNNLKSILEPLP